MCCYVHVGTPSLLSEISWAQWVEGQARVEGRCSPLCQGINLEPFSKPKWPRELGLSLIAVMSIATPGNSWWPGPFYLPVICSCEGVFGLICFWKCLLTYHQHFYFSLLICSYLAQLLIATQSYMSLIKMLTHPDLTGFLSVFFFLACLSQVERWPH